MIIRCRLQSPACVVLAIAAAVTAITLLRHITRHGHWPLICTRVVAIKIDRTRHLPPTHQSHDERSCATSTVIGRGVQLTALALDAASQNTADLCSCWKLHRAAWAAAPLHADTQLILLKATRQPTRSARAPLPLHHTPPRREWASLHRRVIARFGF